ncbi:MAG TPA: IS4 family transposase, partial [Pseudoalteromonas prydzensis]|nr:IS4 family transposase [Pseudoalteromonas prydzensis]
MNMVSNESLEWAQLIFSKAKLTDPRRTKRLVKIAASLASNAGKSSMSSAEILSLRIKRYAPSILAGSGQDDIK